MSVSVRYQWVFGQIPRLYHIAMAIAMLARSWLSGTERNGQLLMFLGGRTSAAAAATLTTCDS